MEPTLSPDDKRQLAHRLSLSCRPHKFPVNLTLEGWFRQGTLGRLKRNFLIRPGAPRTSAAIAALALPKSTVLLEIGCRRADRGRVPRYPGLAVPSERSNASDDDHRLVPFRPRAPA